MNFLIGLFVGLILATAGHVLAQNFELYDQYGNATYGQMDRQGNFQYYGSQGQMGWGQVQPLPQTRRNPC